MFTAGSFGAIDWTVSAHVLIASTTASWLLRTVLRISSCSSWPGIRVSLTLVLLGDLVCKLYQATEKYAKRARHTWSTLGDEPHAHRRDGPPAAGGAFLPVR